MTECHGVNICVIFQIRKATSCTPAFQITGFQFSIDQKFKMSWCHYRWQLNPLFHPECYISSFPTSVATTQLVQITKS